jgi:GTP cyclohydrolase II
MYSPNLLSFASTRKGAGILLYEQQEGRGIGLMAKLRAYELQDQGRDTIEANLELGFKADCRQFELPAEMLKLLGVKAVRLMTNNPEKVEALVEAGIDVVERIAADVPSEPTFERYLQKFEPGRKTARGLASPRVLSRVSVFRGSC